jgi:hypothetical protein
VFLVSVLYFGYNEWKQSIQCYLLLTSVGQLVALMQRSVNLFSRVNAHPQLLQNSVPHCLKPKAYTVILDHQESRCTGNHNIAPKHRSSKNESIQTFIFIQPGLSRHPFSWRITSQFNLNSLWQYWQIWSFFGPWHIFSCCFKFSLPFVPEQSLPHLLWLFKYVAHFANNFQTLKTFKLVFFNFPEFFFIFFWK